MAPTTTSTAVGYGLILALVLAVMAHVKLIMLQISGLRIMHNQAKAMRELRATVTTLESRSLGPTEPQQAPRLVQQPTLVQQPEVQPDLGPAARRVADALLDLASPGKAAQRAQVLAAVVARKAELAHAPIATRESLFYALSKPNAAASIVKFAAAADESVLSLLAGLLPSLAPALPVAPPAVPVQPAAAGVSLAAILGKPKASGKVFNIEDSQAAGELLSLAKLVSADAAKAADAAPEAPLTAAMNTLSVKNLAEADEVYNKVQVAVATLAAKVQQQTPEQLEQALDAYNEMETKLKLTPEQAQALDAYNKMETKFTLEQALEVYNKMETAYNKMEAEDAAAEAVVADAAAAWHEPADQGWKKPAAALSPLSTPATKSKRGKTRKAKADAIEF